MNEAQTEFEYIDPALREAGWGVVEGSKVRKQFPISQGRLLGQGRKTAPLKADYVLEYNNRRLAVIEAKSRDSYYTEGVGQAKDYAERLNIRYTFATNGLQIYQMDMEHAQEGDVDNFPSPDELWNMCFPPAHTEKEAAIIDWKKKMDDVPFQLFKGKYGPRYYQYNAIMKVLDGIAEGKDRLLLTMATGTGKTATAFHICWKLFHAKWNLQQDGKRSPRILFLADRNLLANQAFNAFGDFEDDALVRIKPSDIKKKGKVPTNGSIFFTIFQTFMTNANVDKNNDQSETFSLAAEPKEEYGTIQFNFGQYPSDFFDLIIIDECHRGGAKDESSWRAILDYFSPAVQLGLTATPKRDVNGDTYDYFGKPVYTYSLKAGINDGFLTPFKMVEIKTTIDEYEFTQGDMVEEGEVEYERKYTEADFNRIIQIKEREEYRVKLFMDTINQNQKTLVFCATQIHAAAVRDLINQYATSKNATYCVRVTADDGAMGEQFLADFQDNEKNIPTVLTTSQKLSTGVDAPEIRNIVLLRPVNSMVEFKQIVGRGTRLFDGKDYFTVYDFVNAHHHFKDPEWDGEPLDPEPTVPRKAPKPCPHCSERPCVCEQSVPETCSACGNSPCICDNPPRKMVKIKLADNVVREFDSMRKTSFWSPEGKPISAEEFIQKLFGDLPSFFNSEEELRKIWIIPSTRKRLLEELSEKGYSNEQLEDLRKIVHGEDSDLFDILSYVAYHRDIVPRLERAERAKIKLDSYNPSQQEFLNFVLEQYVRVGVNELDDEKLPDLLELKYNAIADAKKALGDIPSIRNAFIGFQAYLYEQRVG